MTLICPDCKSHNLKKGSQFLTCKACNRKFPIVNGIIRFASDDYVDNFGFEWKIHRTTQIDNKYRKDSQKHFEVRFSGHLKSFKGARVLDVGVGVGRYAQIAEKYGAQVSGIDLSSSVDVAKENLSKDTNIFQANVFDLPFAEESFDIIYSFGVLHHTPNPREAISKLIRLLKPGGLLCVTVYEIGSMYHTSRYARRVTTKIPNGLLYILCLLYVFVMYTPYRYLGLRYGFLGRVLPISLSDNFFEAVLDTFDCYSPKYQFTYKESTIYNWFKEEGLNGIEFKDEPVTLLGKK